MPLPMDISAMVSATTSLNTLDCASVSAELFEGLTLMSFSKLTPCWSRGRWRNMMLWHVAARNCCHCGTSVGHWGRGSRTLVLYGKFATSSVNSTKRRMHSRTQGWTVRMRT